MRHFPFHLLGLFQFFYDDIRIAADNDCIVLFRLLNACPLRAALSSFLS